MADQDLSKLKIDKTKVIFKPRKRRRFIYLALIIIALILLGFLYAKGVFTPAIEVQVATVTQIYPSQTFTVLNASGYVVPQRKAALASKVTGRLVWLGVEEGNRIKKDQLIARLESEDVKAAKDQAKANVEAARFNLDQTKAELRDATLSFDRNKELIARGVIARATYDTALARYEKAVAAAEAAEANLKATLAALEGANVSIEYTLIRAPFDAIVLTKNADIGDIVTPIGAAANAKAAVVTIADMNSLQVETDVSESNLTRIKPGQPCEILLDALPEARFRGAIHMIVPTADRSKATVMVKVRFIDKDPRILPEMSAKVAFLSRPVTAEDQKPRTALNQAAVVTRKDKKIVFHVKESKAMETPVILGEQIGDMIEVREGMKAGDQVVLNPPNRLKNGFKIKIAEK
ncbi:MAG TPA: efflux RND transporter periplasmic adaptor subunit [Thermodesulfobacteriota bacterium]|nr:efflux RND transporter periplasmic adaptor subunit [Thermodesulfobacteriota bacterium]